MTCKNVGLTLKIERITQGLRQREVAARAGISQTQLSDIENAWRSPSAEHLRRICAVLGIEQAEFGSESR